MVNGVGALSTLGNNEMVCRLQEARGTRDSRVGLHRILHQASSLVWTNCVAYGQAISESSCHPVEHGCDMQYIMQALHKDQRILDSKPSTMHVKGKDLRYSLNGSRMLREIHSWAEAYPGPPRGAPTCPRDSGPEHDCIHPSIHPSINSSFNPTPVEEGNKRSKRWVLDLAASVARRSCRSLLPLMHLPASTPRV